MMYLMRRKKNLRMNLQTSDEVEASSIKKSIPSDTASTTQGEEVNSPVQKGDRNSKNPAERER